MASSTSSGEQLQAKVYCPMCTHSVDAFARRHDNGNSYQLQVIQGQNCPRCWTSLDSASIVVVLEGLEYGGTGPAVALAPKEDAKRRRLKDSRLSWRKHGSFLVQGGGSDEKENQLQIQRSA